jgi:hypothetical protein
VKKKQEKKLRGNRETWLVPLGMAQEPVKPRNNYLTEKD